MIHGSRRQEENRRSIDDPRRKHDSFHSTEGGRPSGSPRIKPKNAADTKKLHNDEHSVSNGARHQPTRIHNQMSTLCSPNALCASQGISGPTPTAIAKLYRPEGTKRCTTTQRPRADGSQNRGTIAGKNANQHATGRTGCRRCNTPTTPTGHTSTISTKDATPTEGRTSNRTTTTQPTLINTNNADGKSRNRSNLPSSQGGTTNTIYRSGISSNQLQQPDSCPNETNPPNSRQCKRPISSQNTNQTTNQNNRGSVPCNKSGKPIGPRTRLNVNDTNRKPPSQSKLASQHTPAPAEPTSRYGLAGALQPNDNNGIEPLVTSRERHDNTNGLETYSRCGSYGATISATSSPIPNERGGNRPRGRAKRIKRWWNNISNAQPTEDERSLENTTVEQHKMVSQRTPTPTPNKIKLGTPEMKSINGSNCARKSVLDCDLDSEKQMSNLHIQQQEQQRERERERDTLDQQPCARRTGGSHGHARLDNFNPNW